MQGRSVPDRELLDAAALVGHLVSADSVYAFLAEHRGAVFPDGLFDDLFPSGRGRPSVPGEVIASVLVLQTLQDLSDTEAMQALRCDLRWKVACGRHCCIRPSRLTNAAYLPPADGRDVQRVHPWGIEGELARRLCPD